MKLPNQKGFTLIELLIVIALLGALAVGLIGALDPFEQLKKGTDTGTRDLVNQVQTAVIRYYSVKGNMPWCPNGSAGAGCLADPSETDLETDPMKTAITSMASTGELKADFATIHAKNLSKIFVTGSQANNTIAACYLPTAKSFLADPNTKFTKAGLPVANPETACKGNGGATICYWCIE